MRHPSRNLLPWLALIALLPAGGEAAGARSFKSGPIQITADGARVWLVNPDHDSVSRIDTATDTVGEYPLPAGGPHGPRGLSVREDGAEVWVACHDSDRVYVLRGSDGSVAGQIDLPWGSGPYGIALSRDQRWALVSLHRSSALALLDVQSRSLAHLLAPVYRSPLGIAWMEDGVSAWVTHLFADGEDPFLTRVDVSPPGPRVTSQIIVKSTNPKQSSRLAAGNNRAEGGYLTFRGHLAQVPAVSGRNQVWLPTQYNNINEDRFTPDTTIQTTLRHLDLLTRTIPNTNADKVILSAVFVHDPQSTNGATFVGPGWDAHVSGPVDLGFSADGQTAYLLNEQSNDLVVLPVGTPAVKPVPAAPLPEVPVGFRPIGLAVSPVNDRAYVLNQLSRTVSVVDLAGLRELRQLPATPRTPEPFTPAELTGARIFHSSADPGGRGRISINDKVACASCHPHGEHDGRVWDFESLPGAHGPRSTMSLLGIGRSFAPGQRDPLYGWGQLHRSGDRDEIQDFEHTFQGVNMGGTGFLGAGANPELGAGNAGRDPDLDALAEYLMSLAPVARSPYRAAGGGLSEAAVRGATFFAGANPAGKPADANCASCHVPETGFVDHAFHDVGQRRPGSENEINNRTPAWHVNTPSLIGAWTSPPYDGVAGFASTLIDVVQDLAGRSSHGRPGQLTGRQKWDLAELLGSIDGDLTAAELRNARDTTRPRIVRVEPVSLGRVSVWFSETVDPVTSADPAAYELLEAGGARVAITAAAWDARNGDRVDLSAGLRADCLPVGYTLRPAAGAIVLDVADRASGNTANPVDPADPANLHGFQVGGSLTVTLGASGYEHITIPVHDAGMVGPGLATWGHDAPWLYLNGTTVNKGFVRFDWRSAFAAATGITSSADILDARFSLTPEFGDSNTIRIRRTLLAWSDPATGGDWNSSPTGGPTWNAHAHPSGTWNQPGAGRQTAGVDGRLLADYNGPNDLAATADASVTMDAINRRVEFSGTAVIDAFRFWFDNPTVDYGYALELAPGATQETKFERGEAQLGLPAPVLTITYRLPATATQPGEVSGPVSPSPLLVARAGGDLRLEFEDRAFEATGYNIYEGQIGTWFSHGPAACNVAAPLRAPGRREWTYTPAAGSRYIQVTAANACLEGPTPAGWPSGILSCPP